MAKPRNDHWGGAVRRKLENELRPLLFESAPIGFAEDLCPLPADEYDFFLTAVRPGGSARTFPQAGSWRASAASCLRTIDSDYGPPLRVGGVAGTSNLRAAHMGSSSDAIHCGQSML